MADYYIVVELVKYIELDVSALAIHNSFTYKTKVKTPSALGSYFTDLYGATDLTNKETLNIKGVAVDVETFYSLQTSIVDCEDNEKSFYFDIADQMLYIHFDHDINPYCHIVEYGKVYGYTSDKPRNFNGIDYLPLVKSIPKLSIKVDPLTYTQQSFYGGNVIMKNEPITGSSNDGPFDSNIEFTGNDIYIYYGADDYTYAELIFIANNYIENTIISMNEIIVVTKDKRQQQSPTAPNETFSLDDFPDLDPDLDGTIKPDCYGRQHGIPGICVNSEQVAVDKEFYFASIITAAPAPVFKCKQDEKWTTIVPTATDYANGMASFADADVHVDGDNTKGLEDVRCDGYFRPYYNPADIIADLNLRFLDIVYNTSNYDTTEWEEEKAYLEDVGLYMDDEKELYEWIELLQNGSTVGFQYFFNGLRRTIRLDNPNRTEVRTIYSEEILNELKFDNNEQFFSTHAVVFYRKNHSTDKWKRYKNTDYYLDVIREHRRPSQYETESLLYTEALAEDKSIIIMEDQKEERKIGELVLFGIEFFSLLRIFDIINAEISYKGEKVGQEEVDIHVDDDTGTDTYVETDDTDVDIYVDVDYTVRDIIINYREFLGWERFQVIGIVPDFDNCTIAIEVRQRDYSEEFETITGYIPAT